MFPLYKDNVIFCNIKIKDTVFARERKHADILCPKRCHANVLTMLYSLRSWLEEDSGECWSSDCQIFGTINMSPGRGDRVVLVNVCNLSLNVWSSV